MRSVLGGGALALLFASSVAADALTVTLDDGQRLAAIDMPEGAGWCILWRHSVQGFEVEDCYENQGGAMVLTRARLPDFAAGLDHIPGRGRQVSDGQGGYWIEEIDEPVPGNAYVLRPGRPAVDHRIAAEGVTLSLTAASEHRPVTLALETD
ncbi:DUF1850 domain-containing protein [Paracoccaceae bacterium GXU_MW_L88]